MTDLADAHVKAMDYLKNGGESTCFNLGNCTGNSVLEVIGAAKEITGKDIPAVFDERRQGDPPILVGSANKAERVLGWKPQYGDINTIMEHAWKWYCIKRY